MKKVMKVVNIFLLMSFSSIVLATQLDCPPINVVKSATLTRAIKVSEQDSVWNIMSEAMPIDGHEWNVWLGTSFPEAQNSNQAVRLGQTYFNKIILKTPEIYTTGERTTCIYSRDKKHFIAATNPPKFDTQPNESITS